ncbi:MAG: hypothetical protein ACTTKF_01455 [Bacteroides sp.]
MIPIDNIHNYVCKNPFPILPNSNAGVPLPTPTSNLSIIYPAKSLQTYPPLFFILSTFLFILPTFLFVLSKFLNLLISSTRGE